MSDPAACSGEDSSYSNPAPAWGLSHMGVFHELLHHGCLLHLTSMGPRGTAVSPWAAGESALAPGAPPASPSLLALVFAGLLVSYILTLIFHLLLHGFFLPPPKSGIPVMLSLVRSALGLSQSWLALAPMDTGKASINLSRNHSCSSLLPKPCTQTQHTKK